LVQLDTPWMIAGEGGSGKSRWALAICMSVASGMPLGGLVPDPEGHPVAFISVEDDSDSKRRRLAHQMELWLDRCPWPRENIAKLRANLMMPTVAWNSPVSAATAEIMRAVAAKKGAVRLVVWDPLVLLFDHSQDDKGINTAAGAIAVLTRLLEVSDQGEHFSVGIVHHLNKTGTTYGSAMLTAQCRTVLSFERVDDGTGDSARRLSKLELTKTNESAHLGWTEFYELTDHGAVWPTSRQFGGTDEELLARAIRAGEVDTSGGMRATAEALEMNAAFGVTCDERRRRVRSVLKQWNKAEGNTLLTLGIQRVGRGRGVVVFEAIEGWEPELED